ncbi:unnamed protein product [Rotaria sp. Silwood2]|nr:unnamed protein product [Rotaria sp. Silwood2]CAF3057647.1 unnamed protein product [Rotaria sp. Silwood2]CAF3301642.1 unnamed protein product [Rotaria sp. Silwood2]CAF4372957.1 unnamed protein product [Rotaria sp. Silwood2]
MDEMSISQQQNVEFVGQVPTTKHDEYTQTPNSFFNSEIEECVVENRDDNNVHQLNGNDDIFLFHNDHINKLKDHDLHRFSDDDDDVEGNSDVEFDLCNDKFEAERPPNATELSVMLLFVWRQHSMSKAAANDICRILNTLNIPNMPTNFRGVISHVKKNNPTLLHGNHSFICPSCFTKGSNCSKCDVSGCKSASSYVRTPTSVFTFPLVPQIISILEREYLVSSTYVSGQCSDIVNSRRHQEIIMKEKQIHPDRNIITLTLNNDGVLIKRISRSLWITCACINELPRQKRFQINNILILSISTGSEKPKKKEYSIILQDIVIELRFLENVGFDVILPTNDTTNKNKYTHFHAFAISAVSDKPAQSLMLNIKDSTGYFSCGWCCITG